MMFDLHMKMRDVKDLRAGKQSSRTRNQDSRMKNQGSRTRNQDSRSKYSGLTQVLAGVCSSESKDKEEKYIQVTRRFFDALATRLSKMEAFR